MDAEPTFHGEIRVAARVIDYLSSGLYQNAAACMKELINNSYDADATEVVVSVKPDADFIAIEDNGTGLTRENFVEHFERVAESHKRDDGFFTALGRRKIGKIGIGFIAANEICDEMELYSTCVGSRELLHVVINFGEIRSRSYGERREASGDVVKGDYEGEVLEADESEHYTRIYLKRIRENALPQFIKETGVLEDAGSKSIYGLKLESVRDRLVSLKSWDELDMYSKTRLQIGLNVPVRYLPGWYPEKYAEQLEPFTRRANELQFRVIYDGTEIVKPVVLDAAGRDEDKLEVLSYEGSRVQVSGYLYARHGVYKPSDLNGALLRVCESAVGEYDNSFLGFPKQIEALFQDWTTCELYVSGELDDALNIDRRTFRDTHEAYVELNQWFVSKLRDFLTGVRKELYNLPSKQRRAQKVTEQQASIRQVARRVEENYGAEVAAEINRTFSTSTSQPVASVERKLSRKYDVSEVFDIAIDVAQEVLPQELAARYIAELTRRLSD